MGEPPGSGWVRVLCLAKERTVIGLRTRIGKPSNPQDNMYFQAHIYFIMFTPLPPHCQQPRISENKPIRNVVVSITSKITFRHGVPGKFPYSVI